MTDTTLTTSGDSTGQAKQAASEVKGHATDKAGDVARTAKAEARSVVDDARDQAAGVVSTTRTELKARASEQTKTLSTTLDDIGQQLGGMADNSDDPEAQVAKLARSAADTLGSQARRLDDGGLDGMVDDVKRFARNRPGAFLLGTVAAGFAIGRLAKHADLQQSKEKAQEQLDPEALKPDTGSDDTPAVARS